MEQLHDFTKGKILGPLLGFAGPVCLALFLQAMYGAVDLLIVGRFAATRDVSAVATGSMLMASTTQVLASLSIGVTILLGQKIGERRTDEAGAIIGSSIALFAVLAAVCTVAFVWGAPGLAALLKAPADAFAGTVHYLQICAGGIVFVVAFNVLGSVFRGIGDSKMPLVTVAIACVVNIGLDLAFVAGLGWGAAGAALATVLAQAVSVLLSLVIIRRRRLGFTVAAKDVRFCRRHIRKIMAFGVPIALQDLLVSISFLVVTAIVNGLGLAQSAGVGVAEKVCAFLMLIPSAYMQALSAFVAQNVGAGNMKRARLALFYAMGTSLLAAVGLWYLGFFHGALLGGIFSRDAAVVRMSAEYLKAYSIDCLLTAELFCFNGFYSGIGKTGFVMVQGILGAFAIRIPVAYLVSRMPGATLFHIGLATPASTVVQIVCCGLYFLWLFGRRSSRRPG